MISKYYINYGTGAGNEYAETLEEAMTIADEGAAYTQRDIRITDAESGELAAIRQWWGVVYDPDESGEAEEEIIAFGEFGYYGAWNIL